MNTIDYAVMAIAGLGLIIWLRGCARGAVGDCGLGLVLGGVAGVVYFLLFHLTRSSWLCLLVYGIFLMTGLPFYRRLRRSAAQGLITILGIMITGAAVAEYKIITAGNSLLVIEPYRVGQSWAFDAPHLGLKSEPFVQGIPEMIDRLVADIPQAHTNVRLIFSQRSFPGAQLKLDRRREQDGGNWYFSQVYRMEGWLCPALFKYFPRAPQHIYVKAEPKF